MTTTHSRETYTMRRLPKTRMRLAVKNLAQLAIGNSHYHVFDALGGSVGSSEVCSWRLQAPGHRIAPLHVEIGYQDGAYVVLDACGATYVNGDSRPLGRGRIVCVSSGFFLQVGPYELSVTVFDGEDLEQADPTHPHEDIDTLLERWSKMGVSDLGAQFGDLLGKS
ncbi:MAG: hypothetical protein RR704_09650 [Stenotrophomonas sp.]